MSARKKLDPIFIHSLFRAGSTFFYSALRNSKNIRSYHEPMHEVVGTLPTQLSKLDDRRVEFKSLLRHDFLKGGYFDEYSNLLPEIKRYFKESFSYKLFFLAPDERSPELVDYIKALIAGSKNQRSVLQCTRTFGRIGWIKKNFSSNHIFLLRNPWDQFYSYSVDPYIENTPRLIYSQHNIPGAMQHILKVNGLCVLPGNTNSEKLQFSYDNPITADQKYALFFGLWLQAFITASLQCDLVLDMDEISANKGFSRLIGKELSHFGLESLNLSDADLHRAIFAKEEQNFYQKIEENIFEIFLANSPFARDYLAKAKDYLSIERKNSFKLVRPFSSLEEDAVRLRGLFLGRENTFSKAVDKLHHSLEERDSQIQTRDLQVSTLNQAVTERDAQISSLHHSLEERDSQIQTRDLQVSTLNQAVTERDAQISSLHHSLEERESELAKINFILRRIKSPLRLFNRGISCLLNPIRALKEIRDYRAIKSSGQFDIKYYLNENPDIRIATCDPIRHYCQFGWHEGRNPSNFFNTKLYMSENQDVVIANINPLAHFVRFGYREGRIHMQTGVIQESYSSTTLELPKKDDPSHSFMKRALIRLFSAPALYFYRKSTLEYEYTSKADLNIFYLDAIASPKKVYQALSKKKSNVALLAAGSFYLSLKLRSNTSFFSAIKYITRLIKNEGLFHSIKARISKGINLDVVKVIAEAANSSVVKVLVMDYRAPMGHISAGELATVGILKDLRSIGFEVVFISRDMRPNAMVDENLRYEGVEVINSDSGYESAEDYINKKGHEFSLYYLIRVDVAEAVLDIIRYASPSAKAIFHEPDLYFLRESREAILKNDPNLQIKADATMRQELGVIDRVDHTVIVSQNELAYLRKHRPQAPISVFPVLYAPVEINVCEYSQRKDIFFLGGFGHPPNTDAVIWFVKNVWPLIQMADTKIKFHIIGSEMPQEVLNLKAVNGVVVHGFVENLGPLLSKFRIGIAPLRYGAGIKGKVATTLGAGIPCICSSIAAEGMFLSNGVNAIIADTPMEFSNAVLKLNSDKDLWNTLSSNGRSHVVENFSKEANRSGLLRVLNEARVLPLPTYIEFCRNLEIPQIRLEDKVHNIDVSIIVPVYNQWEFTKACLNSVYESIRGEHIVCEVIIADDCSTDETLNVKNYFPNVRIIRTEKNLGFLRNCNNAAQSARGKYLLLLNNDTIVMPGWLSSLYSAIEDDQRAAIVGSKLLYPDGVIQEAGGAILQDGSAYNLGRGGERDTPVYNFLREVDYISGASILIRSSFWKSAEGFDEGYKNAYCEDSDLAMTARSRGFRVIYQPNSEVIHFEHQSYADQAPSRNTELQQHNIKILVSKWADALGRNHGAKSAPEVAMARAERGPLKREALVRKKAKKFNILFFSPFPSHPQSHGNRTTIYSLAKIFQGLGHKVHFVVLNSADVTEDGINAMQSTWDTFDILDFNNPMLADEFDLPWDSWYEKGLGEKIKCLCHKYEIDIAFCSYIFQSKILEFVPNYILKIIDTHDKMSDRYKMLQDKGLKPEFFSCSLLDEGNYLHRSDIVLARRKEESILFDSLTNPGRSLVVPHLENANFVWNKSHSIKKVGIVASANKINLAMLKDFLNSVEQKLDGKRCPFMIHVAGEIREMTHALPNQDRNIFRSPWIQMHGFVPNISDFYSEMDIIVSPVTIGTGINVKSVQAMAYGMPLLTTANGIKGLETGDPLHTHQNLDELAETLLNLTNRGDELNRLSILSRNQYKNFYSSGLHEIHKIFTHAKLLA
jgi:GT2 family glycosyltransferase/glycosyltransferase involved in cell wall biosynthesis